LDTNLKANGRDGRKGRGVSVELHESFSVCSFFIIKEGFILYYGEAEKRTFERSHHFNIHPKGVIPLGGCTVKTVSDSGDKTKFPMVIEHRDFKGTILLAADSDEEREKWMDMIRNSGRVTWKNAQLGDAMIHQLEQESKKMAEQQEKVKEQLQSEATALAEEKGKKEDLEKQAFDLAREKQAIEEQLAKFQEDKEVTMRLVNCYSSYACFNMTRQLLPVNYKGHWRPSNR
jgi:hypothetical protein